MRIEVKVRLSQEGVLLIEDRPTATVVIAGDAAVVQYVKRLIEAPEDIALE